MLQSSGVVDEASEAAAALNYSVFNWAVGFPDTRARFASWLFALAEHSEEMGFAPKKFSEITHVLASLAMLERLAES